MANNELLTRHKGTRNVYLQSISNSEREVLDIISNFQMTDENRITKLLSIKNSINDKLTKVRELDDTILSILEQKDAEKELETNLSRDDRIQELIVKIEATEVRHESTRARHESTRINTSQHESVRP